MAPRRFPFKRRARAAGRSSKKKEAAADGPTTVAGVTVSHPDRVLFPDQGFTKLALARYYERVSPWLLPHLQDRPLTLVRCPEGYNKDCFYQKHANDTVPDTIGRVKIPEEKGLSWYMIADSLPAVIGLVQMGVLELHTWGAKRDGLDRPDRIIMDLDPDPAVPWKFVIEAAQLVRTLLNELDLECFVKTTGGKGLHVVLPLRRVHTWDEVKAFSKGLADHLERLVPDRFIANMSKQKREGKDLSRLFTQCKRGYRYCRLFHAGKDGGAGFGSARVGRIVGRFTVGSFYGVQCGGTIERAEAGSVARLF